MAGTVAGPGIDDGSARYEAAVGKEVVLVEHEAFKVQFLRQLNLLEDLLVVDVVRRVAVRVIG
jgi:hypothetical protein